MVRASGELLVVTRAENEVLRKPVNEKNRDGDLRSAPAKCFKCEVCGNILLDELRPRMVPAVAVVSGAFVLLALSQQHLRAFRLDAIPPSSMLRLLTKSWRRV